jgi:hypothetical protein
MQTSLLPTRVLDIGTVTSPKIVLIVPANVRADYVCLSYCWGGARFYKTTTDNIQKNQGGISPSDLPPAFNQAIQLVRTLGMRYLWIDALCIVQNDAGDWKFEASRMADVYANCTLTVSLTTLRSPLEIYGLKTSRKQILDMVEINTQQHFPLISGKYSGSFPLLERAWAFQERLLSPKIVHLGWHELHWECQKETICECGYDSNEHFQRIEFHQLISKKKKEQGSMQGSRMLDRIPALQILKGPSLDQTIVQMWRKLLEAYCSRKLTFQADKLLALSGIAEVVRRARKDDYLAGLWGRTLVVDLCWAAGITHISSSDRGSIYTAPSWSWASTNKPLLYLVEEVSQDMCTVLGHHVVQDGASLTGKVCSGWIMLRTLVMPCSTVKEYPSGPPVLRVGKSSLDFYHDAIESWEGGEVFVALILWYKSYDTVMEAALVVRRLCDDELNKPECFCDRQGDRYRRVGIVFTDKFSHGTKDLWEERTIILV